MSSIEPSQLGQEPPPLGDLPEVHPPSTGFFVQLFVLPALIVFGIMTVWFLFGKLAGGERSMDEYLAIIKQSDRGDRWKAAHDLTHLLRDDSIYARDPQLALQLTSELQAALEQTSSPDVQYEEFLCGALGSMQLPTGVPMLRRAARPEHSSNVRRAALIALARLGERIPDLEDPSVVPEVRDHLTDDDAEIRELAAFTLGFLRDPKAIPALTAALNDPQLAVRYNAANALASLGSDAAMPIYLQMLDQKELSKHFLIEHTDGQVDESIVLTTMLAALRSLGSLKQAKPGADFASVVPAVRKLQENENPVISSEAKELLIKLDSPSALAPKGEKNG